MNKLKMIMILIIGVFIIVNLKAIILIGGLLIASNVARKYIRLKRDLTIIKKL